MVLPCVLYHPWARLDRPSCRKGTRWYCCHRTMPGGDHFWSILVIHFTRPPLIQLVPSTYSLGNPNPGGEARKPSICSAPPFIGKSKQEGPKGPQWKCELAFHFSLSSSPKDVPERGGTNLEMGDLQIPSVPTH